MNTTRSTRKPKPDSDGWIDLIAAGKKWGRYHPGKRKLHRKDGNLEVYFDLNDYDAEEKP